MSPTLWVLIAAIVGSAMSFIDGTAVNVALPVLARDLNAGPGPLQWVVEGYSLFLSAGILIGGVLGDRFGRKRVFGIGIGLFATASAACALAPTIDMLVLARCVQGVGGALAAPGSLALISANFPVESRGKAIGTWSGFSGITTAAGPVLGGWLTQTAGWRWVFAINIPLAVLVLVALTRVPESRDPDAPRSLDFAGAGLVTFGLGALVAGCIRLQDGVHPLGAGLVAAGCVALAAFVYVERHERTPMVRLDLFASRTFSAANVYTLFLYAALGGGLYFVPFILIDVHGYPPAAAGAALLPFIVTMFVASRWSGGLVARIGARIPLTAGAVLCAFAYLAFALPGAGGSYWATFFPAVMLLGCGGVLFVAPLTTVVMSSVPDAHAGLASGINNAVSRTGGLLAIAMLGILASTFYVQAFAARAPAAGLDASSATMYETDRTAAISGKLGRALPVPVRERATQTARAAYVTGFRATMIACAALSLLAAGIALYGISARPRSSAPVSVATATSS